MQDLMKQLTKTLLDIGSQLKESHTKLMTLLIKSCVLASVAIISTWMFLFVGMLLIPDIGWFIPIDGMFK